MGIWDHGRGGTGEGGSVRCALEKGRTVTIGQCTKKTLSLSLSFHEWLTVMGWDGTWHLPSFPIRLFQCVRYTLPPTPPHPFSPYFPLLLFFLLRSRCLYSKLHHLHPSTHTLLPHTYELFIYLLFCKSKIQCHLSFWLVGFCLMHQKFNAIWVFKIKNYF